jgi:hypothetical protein
VGGGEGWLKNEVLVLELRQKLGACLAGVEVRDGDFLSGSDGRQAADH